MASTLTFSKNKELLGAGSAVGVLAEAPKDPLLALALAQNKPFPAGTTELGKLQLSGKAGKDVIFGKGKGKVSFSGKGGAFSSLGVYSDGAQLLGSLDLAPELGAGVNLPSDAAHHYVALRWGYNAQASAKGSVALGAGLAPTFEGSAQREAAFAVIRQLPVTTGARTSIQKTVNSWMLPKQARSIDQLEPGTWIVAEVDGSIGLKLGAQYGYDFNWVRQAKLGGLSGDIGLRIQAGVSVALGFSASGSYAVVLSRDALESSSRKIRVRLYKLSKKGWNFALNAGAKVQGDTGSFLPGSFDQFVAAVFGLDPAQLMADLETLKTWTDPNQDLGDLLAGAGVDRARKLLADVTGLDPETEFNKARTQVLSVLTRWDNLDHTVATRLWSLVPQAGALDRVRSIAQQIAGADQKALGALLDSKLADVDFFRTPEGQWLEAAAGDRLLTTLTSSPAFKRLQGTAKKTLALLDGSKVEQTLGKLHDEITQRLQLDRIKGVVDQASFANMDAWLKAKLSDFLGAKLNLAKLDEIRKTIQLLLKKKDAFYTKAVEALNRSYQFNFTATYQRNTAKTALLDVTFDFSQGDVGKSLQAAVNGNFDKLLVEQTPGVSLNLASLTHEVTRQSAVSIDLPFFKKNVTQMNSSLAKVSPAEDDGRLLLYTLDASSTVEESINARNKRNSRLTIGADLQARPGSGVRVHTTNSLSYSYSFRQATANMRRRGLVSRLQPYVDRYFPDHFSTAGSFSTWIGDLDRTIDSIEPNGTDNFGNTLLSLDVSLPAEVSAAWLEAPANKNDEAYAEMSRRLQTAIKATLVDAYFSNLEHFKNIGPARTLLAYAAIPPSTAVDVRADGTIKFDRPGDIMWDWPSNSTRRAMVESKQALFNLGASLARLHQWLQTEPGLSDKVIAQYAPTEANRDAAVRAALGASGPVLNSLLFVEARIVRAARDAGLNMARYRSSAESKPSKAIENLEKFGDKLTTAFNQKLKSVYKSAGPLRPLGTRLFVAAATAFNPKLAKVTPVAMAGLTVLKSSVEPFPPAGFPNYPTPAAADVLITERLVNTG